MRMILLIISLLIAGISIGCSSIVLPYKEEPLCSRALSVHGYCGSVTDVYERVNQLKDKEKEEKGERRK